jgi:hypothetical protein
VHASDLSQLNLLPHHLELLERSAISPDVARARGYRSVTTRLELRGLGFSQRQARVPALLVPIRGVAGDVVLYQARPDEPRIAGGKPLKYETPAGAHMAVDVPPQVRPWLTDPARPLFITEGARKADAAVSRGLAAIALLGVWSWRGTGPQGGKAALSDWEAIALKGRRVYLAFDSDVTEKRAVRCALARLKSFLEGRGADVRVIYLEPGDGGVKVGLDDFFAAGGTVEKLLELAEEEIRPDGGKDDVSVYEATEAGLVWHRPAADGDAPVPLSNFSAVIKADTLLDDGLETRREFEIEASLKGRTSCFTIPALQFPSMSWPTCHLGAEAIVYPGPTVREHARCAVQVLSGEVEKRVLFTHTGWRKIAGEWVYLHAAGAVGKGGAVPGIAVVLSSALRGYELPPPPEGEDLASAVRQSLGLLDVAPDAVTLPLLGAVARAALGSADLSVHLAGPSGAGKTELAALAQQHFGPALDARNLPGSWSSTANALERIAFDAKDALLVIDDFAPGGAVQDIQRLHREADRILRAQGNRSGRGRMRSDGSLQEAKPPRGLILSTGEDVPRGRSLRARIVSVEVQPGAVRWDRMTACQRAAREGAYARALSGFVRWVADRYEEARAKAKSLAERLREELPRGKGSHPRSPGNLAELVSGFESWIEFAVEVGAIGEEAAGGLRDRARDAAARLLREQDLEQESEEPAVRYFELLGAALAGGRAHLRRVDGSCPVEPGRWGWQSAGASSAAPTRWEPQGEFVGWVGEGGAGADGGPDLFLEPEAAYAVVQTLAKEQGEPFALGPRTLQRRLRERGQLVLTDAEHATVRESIGGERRRVLRVRASVMAASPSTEWSNGPA